MDGALLVLPRQPPQRRTELTLDVGDDAVQGPVERGGEPDPSDELTVPPKPDVAGRNVFRGDDATPHRVGHRLHGREQRVGHGEGG